MNHKLYKIAEKLKNPISLGVKKLYIYIQIYNNPYIKLIDRKSISPVIKT